MSKIKISHWLQILPGLTTGECCGSIKDRAFPPTLYCQKYSLTCLDSHMNLSEIPYLVHSIYKDIGPPVAAITATTLLGRLSTRFWSVYGNFGSFFQMHIWEVTH